MSSTRRRPRYRGVGRRGEVRRARHAVSPKARVPRLGDEGAQREAELIRIARRHGMRLIGPLQAWPLLDGARGRARCGITALVDALVRLGWLGITLGQRLTELDVNPLLVQTKGVVALDARATIGVTGASL